MRAEKPEFLNMMRVEEIYDFLYNNQINARALIGQSAMGYCAGKPMEKLNYLNYYIKAIDHKLLWVLG